MAGLGPAAAAEESSEAIGLEAPARAFRLGPEDRRELSDGALLLRLEAEDAWASQAPLSSPPEPDRFSLLPETLPGEAGPSQGWRLLAQDEKVPSDVGADAPKKAGPDWPGIGRDTAFFLAYQAISVSILYALPGNLNRWDNKDVSLQQWWDNVKTPPVWDSDPWATNFLSHPYWGATYYIRARERGFGKFASFGYSAFLSTLYEYGAEAFFEPPSAQDLMLTPILGSLIGAFIFEPIRDWVKVKAEVKWYDQAILIATDPFGTLNSIVEVMFGI